MKKTYIIIALITTLIAGTMFNRCSTPAQSEATARPATEGAGSDMPAVRDEAGATAAKAVTVKEWESFKSSAESRIRINEVMIAELKQKIERPPKAFDPLYEKRINSLEARNKRLKLRIDRYDESRSDWDSFKSEFDRDMAELGEAFTDISVDNTK